MIVVMHAKASLKEIGEVIRRVEGAGFPIHQARGEEGVVVGVVGHRVERLRPELAQLSGVKQIVDARSPFTLASREYLRSDTIVDVQGVAVGDRAGLPVVTEILSPGDVDLFVQYADVMQIGARNMQNFSLLGEVGRANRPVLLKRGMMSTVEELLLAAAYILSRGNSRVVLCERGIRTFETSTRNTPDIAAIPVVKQLSHLPILFDPSHAAGQRRFVAPFARAGIAAGADGLIVEVHAHPERALCDGDQALTPADFHELVLDVRRIAVAIGREAPPPTGAPRRPPAG